VITRRVALLLAFLPAAAGAQVRPSASGGVFLTTRLISFDSVVYQQTGMLAGGAASARLSRFTLEVAGVFGTMSGDSTTEEQVRSTSLRLLVGLAPWLDVGAALEGRVFTSDVATASWRLMGVTVRATPPLGGSGLQGLVEVAMYPSTAVGAGSTIKTALQAMVGARLVTRGPFAAQVGYRFERYDFEAAAANAARLEQFSGVVASIGLRFGR